MVERRLSRSPSRRVSKTVPLPARPARTCWWCNKLRPYVFINSVLQSKHRKLVARVSGSFVRGANGLRLRGQGRGRRNRGGWFNQRSEIASLLHVIRGIGCGLVAERDMRARRLSDGSLSADGLYPIRGSDVRNSSPASVRWSRISSPKSAGRFSPPHITSAGTGAFFCSKASIIYPRILITVKSFARKCSLFLCIFTSSAASRVFRCCVANVSCKPNRTIHHVINIQSMLRGISPNAP